MTLYEYYNKIEKDIKGFAKSLSKNDWEDLMQQAWLKAVNNQYIFEDMNYYQARSWFYKVIRTSFIDTLRKKRDMVYIEDSDEDFKAESDIKNWIAQYSAEKILQAISGEDKNIFAMRYISGYNSSEIGNIIGMNPSTVRYRLRKSAEKIKSKIKRSDYYE